MQCCLPLALTADGDHVPYSMFERQGKIDPRLYSGGCGGAPTDCGEPAILDYMNRRTDEKTAERIHIALLTQAAFDVATALEFARLSGVQARLAELVLSREPGRVRQQASLFVPAPDRRSCVR